MHGVPVPVSAPGMIVHHATDDGVVFAGAVGQATFEGPPLSTDHAFQIASVTKPYTAIVALQLHDEGLLDLDESISRWIDGRLVDDLLVIDGVPLGREITARNLLNHTSGLADRSSADGFAEAALGDTTRVWEPEDLVRWTIKNLDPLFEPGASGSYADDGYVLLAMIAENVTGKPLHDLFQTRIFEPLQLTRTWLHGKQQPLAPMADSYLGSVSSLTLEPSVDWGAGGVVSTAAELARFGQALVRGELIRDQSLAGLLFEPAQPFAQPLEQLSEDVFLHSGFWGVYLVMNRRTNNVVAATVNQAILTDEDKDQIRRSLRSLVR